MWYTITMISEEYLLKNYCIEGWSVSDIASELHCSQSKVTYWLHKYNITKRTISEAIYLKSNPDGDPFRVKKLKTKEDWFLYGLGLGLYWGEGTKSNKHTVRLGNTDPNLIKKFIKFLCGIYSIDTNKLHYGLQVFSDMDPLKAQQFWMKELSANQEQFQKVIVTPARGVGTYKNKTKHGVLTVHFNNKKLRDIIVDTVREL